MRLLISIALMLYCIVFTAPTAPSPGNGDPLYYMHASRTLRAGEGLRNLPDAPPETERLVGENGGVFAIWTPLYPVMLSLFDDPLEGARWLNALGLFASVLLVYALARVYELPTLIAAGAALIWLLSKPAADIYREVMSETIFVPLVLLWFIGARQRWHPVVFGAVGASLLMTRYIGGLFVVLGLLVYARPRDWAAYLWLPSTAGMWWFARNFYLTDTLTGHTQPGWYTLNDAVWYAVEVIAGWIPIALLVAGGGWCLWAALFVAAVCYAGTRTLINQPTDRLLAPALPLLAIGIAVLIKTWRRTQ